MNERKTKITLEINKKVKCAGSEANNARLLYLKRIAYLSLIKRMTYPEYLIWEENLNFVHPLDEELIIKLIDELSEEIGNFKEKLYLEFC